MFRPVTLVRHIRPTAGSPRIRIWLQPTFDAGRGRPRVSHGSNHIRYVMAEQTLRLTTDASVTAILDQTAFVVEQDVTLVLGPDETLQGAVAESGRRFFEETVDYWHEWVRYLSIPFEWQEAVIRAAITLKLNAYDDTGAIVAAMTTSIPRGPQQRAQLGLPFLLAARRAIRSGSSEPAGHHANDGAVSSLHRQRRCR